VTAFSKRITDMGVPGYGEDELIFMHKTVKAFEPDRIFDWGTNVGASARIFYEATKRTHCVIETIELPRIVERLDRDYAGDRTGRWLVPGIRQHWGDGVTVALTRAAIWQPARPLFFLDGNHLRENVFREIWAINKFCPHGALLIHDTRQQPGEAVAEWRERYGGYLETALGSQAGMILLTRL
jgi:hypothetical protein